MLILLDRQLAQARTQCELTIDSWSCLFKEVADHGCTAVIASGTYVFFHCPLATSS